MNRRAKALENEGHAPAELANGQVASRPTDPDPDRAPRPSQDTDHRPVPALGDRLPTSGWTGRLVPPALVA